MAGGRQAPQLEVHKLLEGKVDVSTRCEQQIDRPATTNMRALGSTVGKKTNIRAARPLQHVRQDTQARSIQRAVDAALCIDCLRHPDDSAVRFQRIGSQDNAAEGEKHISQKVCLNEKLCLF